MFSIYSAVKINQNFDAWYTAFVKERRKQSMNIQEQNHINLLSEAFCFIKHFLLQKQTTHEKEHPFHKLEFFAAWLSSP